MNRLLEIIERATRKHGVISFARFMELALYCPVYGYYEKEGDTVGRRGDFFTSVSVGSLFGELLAFQFSEWLDEMRGAKCAVRVVEGGAHDGRLAKDILAWLGRHRPDLKDQFDYIIVEPSVRLRERQKQLLGEFARAVHWVSGLEELAGPGVCGLIFSNELLDSMPVHRLGWDAAKREWFEWGVAVQDGRFGWRRKRLSSQSANFGCRLPAGLLDVLPDGFTTEICSAAIDWWGAAARVLRRGRLLTIDYGLASEEFFAPERKAGTLRAYFQHHSHGDLLANVGEQDITAHLDFTAIQEAGEAAGLKTERFAAQSQFLTGIAERFWRRQKDPGEWTAVHRRQFQTLTHPEHLGRPFRVLVQSRG